MENFKLYYISEEYIEYLRTFDKRVAYNKKKQDHILELYINIRIIIILLLYILLKRNIYK